MYGTVVCMISKACVGLSACQCNIQMHLPSKAYQPLQVEQQQQSWPVPNRPCAQPALEYHSGRTYLSAWFMGDSGRPDRL